MIASIASHPVATDIVGASHHGYHDVSWFPWFPLVPLFAVGAWVLLVTLVLRRRGPRAVVPSAEQELAVRFARGEIDEVEYRERRSVLRSR